MLTAHILIFSFCVIFSALVAMIVTQAVVFRNRMKTARGSDEFFTIRPPFFVRMYMRSCVVPTEFNEGQKHLWHVWLNQKKGGRAAAKLAKRLKVRR